MLKGTWGSRTFYSAKNQSIVSFINDLLVWIASALEELRTSVRGNMVPFHVVLVSHLYCGSNVQSRGASKVAVVDRSAAVILPGSDMQHIFLKP